MRFDGVLQRAKDRGIKMLMIQLNPSPRLYSTMSDKDMTSSLGMAMALVARKFSENSKGKYSPEVVLEKMFLDVKIHATSILPKLGDQTAEEMAFRNMTESMTKKLIDSGEFDDLIGDEDDGNGGGKA
jgi:hypothetical protein